MEILHPRCAGLDVSKEDVKVCVRVIPEGRVRATSQVSTWSAMPAEVETIAEMIETQDCADILKDIGVDLGQGWLFGKAEAEHAH